MFLGPFTRLTAIALGPSTSKLYIASSKADFLFLCRSDFLEPDDGSCVLRFTLAGLVATFDILVASHLRLYPNDMFFLGTNEVIAAVFSFTSSSISYGLPQTVLQVPLAYPGYQMYPEINQFDT